MISAWRFRPGSVIHMLVLWIGMEVLVFAGYGRTEVCTLSPNQAGLTFHVERVDPVWTCRLQAIIQSHTTVSKVGPIRTALSESMYRHLLDHPPFTADVIRRLHLGLYRSEERGPGRFSGDDGEGTKGTVELAYEDPRFRIYFLEGTHESRLLPHIRGKAVVFLRIGVVQDANGNESTDSTLVAYTKLDNPFLSGLVSLLHPLVSKIVTSRLQKGVETVDRLGRAMRQDPDRVMVELMKPPPLPEHHVAFLNQALRGSHGTDQGRSDERSIP